MFSFVRAGRLPSEGVGPGFVKLAPDLVVEVVSPNESAAELQEKLDDYRTCGTPLVWVIHPKRRTVRIIAEGEPAPLLHETDVLDGGTVLPGFHCNVADLFEGIARY